MGGMGGQIEPKTRGEFAGGGAEAEVALAEAGVEFGFVQGGFEDFADELFFFGEAVGVGMVRALPMGEQAAAGFGVFPEQASVFEARDVAIVRVFAPGGHGSCVAHSECILSRGSPRFNLGYRRSWTEGTTASRWP